jgi:hypothetical protein
MIAGDALTHFQSRLVIVVSNAFCGHFLFPLFVTTYAGTASEASIITSASVV